MKCDKFDTCEHRVTSLCQDCNRRELQDNYSPTTPQADACKPDKGIEERIRYIIADRIQLCGSCTWKYKRCAVCGGLNKVTQQILDLIKEAK